MKKLFVRELKGYAKIQGLIGKNEAESVYFQTRFGIHTFFLKFPIDVVVLDKNNKVVKLQQNLAPNRIFVCNPRYFYVLELPKNTINKMKLSLGDKVNVENIKV